MALTPMMQHYLHTKEQYKDCILLYRLGDFYEMFFDDAVTVAHELELTLTGKDCGLAERAPMCGVPHHAVNTYVERLIQNGHKVAICEQMEDPATAKGIVKRDVVRIITPGTVSDAEMLDEHKNNFLLSIDLSGEKAGLAMADVSTGEFVVNEISNPSKTLNDEISRIQPTEIIVNDLVTLRGCIGREESSASEQPSSWFQYQNVAEEICSQFELTNLSSLGLDNEYKLAACAAGALLRYLKETQKITLSHITDLRIFQGNETMLLDSNTRRNLELTESIRGRTRKGSLLALMDKTSTAMGSRLLRTWVEEPLQSKDRINRRLDAVEEFVKQHVLTMTLSDELQGVYDIERLLSKVAYKSVNARDCIALANSLSRVPGIRHLLDGAKSQAVQELRENLDPMDELVSLLQRSINPDAPIVITDGDIIRDGYSSLLDEYRAASTGGKQWILDLEQKEREETGIRNLRIQYNRVFGYYIEVTKSYYDLVPARYQRKQTLATCERYTIPELTEIEQKIVGAQEQSVRLELQLFSEIRDKIASRIAGIQKTANALKTLDAILSLAKIAVANNYVRPEINEDGILEIEEGRHPVVEANMQDGCFISNDTHMDNESQRMLIITGPNMAGKSTYMRQVALITLMAHMGSFVPAHSANICVVDRIFTRVGASDDLASGQSTFMVEMSETAYILRNATKKSLVILDEIGRGTSTFDGLSIAWAVVEYLADKEKVGAKTLFATHYHELSELEGHLEGVQNYCISVKEHGEDVIFLRKIVRGGADKSFGVHVARLAGIPKPVIIRAHEIQARLEVSDINQNTIGQNILGETAEHEEKQVDMFSYRQTEIINELQTLDVMALTPIDAMNELFLLREKARNL